MNILSGISAYTVTYCNGKFTGFRLKTKVEQLSNKLPVFTLNCNLQKRKVPYSMTQELIFNLHHRFIPYVSKITTLCKCFTGEDRATEKWMSYNLCYFFTLNTH